MEARRESLLCESCIQELLGSGQRLHRVLEKTGIGIWSNELPMGRMSWNRQTRRLFFVAPGVKPTLDLFWSRLHPEDREPTRLAFESAVRNRGLFEIDHRAVNPETGEIRWIRSSGQAAYATDGTPVRLDGINYDITERKRAEEELSSIHQRLQALMNALPVGVSFSDDATCGNITGNPAVLSQFEVGKEDNLSASTQDDRAPGRQVQYFRAGRLISGAELPLQRAIAENRVIPPMELEIRLPSGKRWFAEASGAPIYDTEGHVVAGLAVTLDITERKKTERKLIESEAKLRKAHSDLKAIMNRLEDIREEERAAIARELHDELGQVLAGFRMDLSWLLKRLPPEKGDLIRKAQFMKSYIDPAIALIRRISTELRPGILDDLGLVATIEWQLQILRNRTGMDCEFVSHIDESELDGKLKTVLFRIVQESMTNIIRHAGATAVRMSLVEVEGNLNLKIEDNGKGIRSHDLRKTSSTGLRGMRERLAFFNGKFSVKGEPGKGTTLDIVIPQPNKE
jgi:signal transduction histidine kinase